MAAENRKYKRHALAHKGMIYTTKGARIASCVLRNVSVGGAQLELKREIEWPKDICACALRDKVVRRRCQIVWQFATVLGVSF
jgi:hypothetical protein